MSAAREAADAAATKAACDRCTSSKVACDGKRPCGRCSRMTGVEASCTYSAPKRRGPQPGFKRRREEDGEAGAPSQAAGAGAPSALGPDLPWVQQLFWPGQRALQPSATEAGYLRSFFLQTRTVMPLVDEARFYIALREASDWPITEGQAAVPGDLMGAGGGDDPHTGAQGFSLLYYAVLGLGAGIQGRRLDSMLYLQRAVAQLGPALLVPSETAAVAFGLIALAAQRVHPDPHRAQSIMASADGMLHALVRKGRPCGLLVRIFIGIQYRVLCCRPGVRISAPVPGPDPVIEAGDMRYPDEFTRVIDLLWFIYTETMYGLSGRTCTNDKGLSTSSSSSTSAQGQGPSSARPSSGGSALSSDAPSPSRELLGAFLEAIDEATQRVTTHRELRQWYLRGFLSVGEVVARLAGRMPISGLTLVAAEAALLNVDTLTSVATHISVLCGRLLAVVASMGYPVAAALVDASSRTSGVTLLPLLDAAASLVGRQDIHAMQMPAQELVTGVDRKILSQASVGGGALAALAAASASVVPDPPRLPGEEPSEFDRACKAALQDGRAACLTLDSVLRLERGRTGAFSASAAGGNALQGSPELGAFFAHAHAQSLIPALSDILHRSMPGIPTTGRSSSPTRSMRSLGGLSAHSLFGLSESGAPWAGGRAMGAGVAGVSSHFPGSTRGHGEGSGRSEGIWAGAEATISGNGYAQGVPR